MIWARTLHRIRFRGRLGAMLVAVLVSSGLAASTSTPAQPNAEVAASRPRLSHALQGMKFAGPLAVDDEENPVRDVLTFEDGRFSSQACLSYGFEPAPYWVRRDARGLHFHADLESQDRGTIEFEGTFDGEQMLATAHWTKKRWYWTVEQDFRFSGHPLPRVE